MVKIEIGRAKILIIGNIGSGKTTLSKKILEVFPVFEPVRIDELRIEYGDGSFAKEYKSWSVFFERCENQEQYILEFSGGGIHKHAIRESLERSNMRIIVIYLDTNLQICKERILDRNWATPYPWRSDPVGSLESIDKELKQDWAIKYWGDLLLIKPNTLEEVLIYLEEML